VWSGIGSAILYKVVEMIVGLRARGNPMAAVEDIDLTITDDLLREIHEAWEARTLRLKHPYVFDFIKVLATSAKSPRMSVIDRLYANRKNAGLPIPEKFDSVVQAQCNYYCRDSDVFKKRGAPAVGRSFLLAKRKGRWSVGIDSRERRTLGKSQS
jgi:hypothetical protein